MVVFSKVSSSSSSSSSSRSSSSINGMNSFASHILNCASVCFGGSDTDAHEITRNVLDQVAAFVGPSMETDISLIATSCKSLCIANSNHNRRQILQCESCCCKEASISPRVKKTVKLVLRDGMSVRDTHEHLQSLMNEQTVELMGPILSAMMVHKENKGVFDRPVDYVALNLPDYPAIVKRPMDLGTIRKRLHNGEYVSLDTFADDVRLVFRNAMTFNHHTHPIYKKAYSMSQSFEEILHKTKIKTEKIRQEQVRHRCEMCDQGSVCPYCMLKCRKLSPPVMSCDRCQTRVPVRSSFYCLKGTKKVWCPKCYGRHGKPEMFDGIGGGPQKYRADNGTVHLTSALLKQRKVYAGTTCTEAWIECVSCSTRYHQACALYNPWDNTSCSSSSSAAAAEFVCLSCRSIEKKKSFSFLPRAKHLPRSDLSDRIETRLRDEIQNRNVSQTFCLREVSRTKQISKLSLQFLKCVSVAMPECVTSYPEYISNNSRVLHLYQRIDGVDVLLFAMYVSEFGKDAPVANRMSTYISYLDSVHFMRPRTLRTKVYHTILCAYIADAKRRGFTNAHIWACPPLRTAEYILHKHPRSQRTPGWERLRKWYDEMIRKAHAEGSVVEVGTMYKDHFSLPKESRDRAGVPAPYFPKHHWIEQLELAVHTQRNPISMGPVSRRLRSGSNNSNEMTTSPKKKRRSSSSSSKNKSSLTKKRKTIEKIAISSSSSNNKMFRKRLQGPPNQLSREFARRLTPMAERLLVLRLQPMCTACSQYVQFGETAYRCTGSCCSSSSSYDDDDDVTSQKRRKTSVIKQSDLWTGGSTSSPVISAKNLIHSSAYFCERCCCNVIEKNKKHFDIRRYGHKGPLKPLKIVSSNSSSCLIDDDDDEKEEYTISNPIVDDRLTFLAFCTGNHLQFDTLRHAKYSSILLLHMLFQNREDTIRTFVRYCNVCRIPIAKGERWHCDQCLSFDLCSNCVNKHQTTNNKHLALHEHPLRRVKVGNTPFQAHMNVLS